MDTIFRKGDKVFDIRYRWGLVIDVNNLTVDWPIEVLFDGDEKLLDEYTFDGRSFINYPPTLSFTEYTLEGFSQERPEELPKKGDIVWAREEYKSYWQIGHFYEKKDGRYLLSSGRPDGWSFGGVEITTKNPYENKES